MVGDPLDQRLFEAAGFDMEFVEGRRGAGTAAAGAAGGGGLELQVVLKASWPPPGTDAMPHMRTTSHHAKGADIEMSALPQRGTAAMVGGHGLGHIHKHRLWALTLRQVHCHCMVIVR